MADPLVTALSLCSGAGGLELGLNLASPRLRVLGYVERDAYAAACLLARMEDAALELAPVWCGDIAELDPAPFRGVDLVSAGFPCQPSSAAGRRRGTNDARWLWPEIARVVGAVDPRLVLVENVPGLLTVNGGAAFGEVVEDLAALGFDAEWDLFSASETGAPHRRERLYLLAVSRRRDVQRWAAARGLGGATLPGAGQGLQRERRRHAPGGGRAALADTPDAVAVGRRAVAGQAGAGAPLPRSAGPGGAVGDSHGGHVALGERGALTGSLAAPFPPGPADAAAWRAILAARPDLAPALAHADDAGQSSHGEGASDLRSSASARPTPTSEDGESSGHRPATMGASTTLTAAVRSTTGRPKLNPAFVEWLMGWPEGWADAGRSLAPTSSERSVTVWFRSQQLWLSRLLHGGCG